MCSLSQPVAQASHRTYPVIRVRSCGDASGTLKLVVGVSECTVVLVGEVGISRIEVQGIAAKTQDGECIY
jgi:hypothetical protein